jgi:hypothetical protein
LNFQYVNELSFLIHSIYEKYIRKPNIFLRAQGKNRTYSIGFADLPASKTILSV